MRTVCDFSAVACLYCKMLIEVSGMMIHLFRQHPYQTQVKMAMIKDDSERQSIVDKLCRWGNFTHNMGVRKQGLGVLIIGRSFVHENFKQYLPCVSCLRFYHENDLCEHYKGCYFKLDIPKENIIRGGRLVVGDLPDNESFIPCVDCLNFYPMGKVCSCKQSSECAKLSGNVRNSHSNVKASSPQFVITEDGTILQLRYA